MALIVWEEFLFPVRINPIKDEIIFRNHFTKLKTQVLIYCAIPVIVVFIYINYDVHYFWFMIWAAVCMISPAGKLVSGVMNYNDFLKLSNRLVEYKDNNKHEVLPIAEIRDIMLIRDETNVLRKIKVLMKNNNQVLIDLEEMELEAYCQTIDEFINAHYKVVMK
jgi:hypothetical protein